MKVKKRRKTEISVFKAESIAAYDEYMPTVGSSTGLVSMRSHTKQE